MAGRMKKPLLVLAIVGFWLFAFSATEATILNASIVNTSSNNNFNVYYYVTGAAYLDLLGGNPELGARVCSDTAGELNNKYVTFVYKAGNRSTYKIIAQEGGTGNDVVQFSGCGATKCCTSPTNLDFKDTGAYYPAYVYAVVSSDNVVDAGDTFIWMPTSGGWLQGSYTVSSSVQSSYSQTNGNVSITVSTVTGTTSTGSYTITADVSFLVEAVCDAVSELQAFNCSSSIITDPGSTVSLHTGVMNPADTVTYTKYYLINGINTSFCIGPDLRISSVSLNPSSAYPGQSVNVTATVNNNNNVDVTQNFKIAFYNGTTNFANSSDVAGLTAGSSTSKSVTFDTTGLTSGAKTITAKVLDKSNNPSSTIEDCNNNNDDSSTTLTMITGYFLTVYVNGTQADVFPTPGIPYNVTVQVADTDGGSCSGLTLKIIERNGLNLFAPTQGFLYDSTKRGVASVSIAEVVTNGSGAASFALIPTGNKLYLPEYAYLNASEHVGNYSLYIELYSGSTRLSLSQAGYGNSLNNHTLNLSSHTSVQPSAANQNTLYVINQNQYVQTIISFFNQAYASVYKWLGT